MLTRQQKTELVDEVARQIREGKSVTVIDYKGLNANDMVVLKKRLREVGAPLRIIKKSLLAIAMKEAGIDAPRGTFDGQAAIAVATEDEVSAAKVIADFMKKNENIRFTGGVLGGKVLSAEEMKALSKLPGRDQLRAQVVGTLNAPISGFVNVLAGNLRSLVTVLKAISDQKA